MITFLSESNLLSGKVSFIYALKAQILCVCHSFCLFLQYFLIFEIFKWAY